MRWQILGYCYYYSILPLADPDRPDTVRRETYPVCTNSTQLLPATSLYSGQVYFWIAITGSCSQLLVGPPDQAARHEAAYYPRESTSYLLVWGSGHPTPSRGPLLPTETS